MKDSKSSPQKKSVLQWVNGLYFAAGAVFGLTAMTVAFGSVPKAGRVTDDTAIYQNLSEIKIPKERAANFDADIERLNSLEGRYRERLPSMARLHSPMKRVSGQKYKFRKNQAGSVSQ